jgi:D-3-phosphoglycerate dehydrogenase
MFKIQTLNKISPAGLSLLPYDLYESASEITNPDAILVRSFNMHEYKISDGLLAIDRAGAGVNNIPVEDCTKKGIVVFNTPGANANAVKELVLAALFLSSRNIVGGIQWVKSLGDAGEDVSKLVEKGKSNYVGPEVMGKTLGIIGLGAIGRLVANAAESLGMKVIGFDPYISVDAAWGLSQHVQKARGFEHLLSKSDYLSLHVPLTEDTRGFIDKSKFKMMKEGVRILNFARGGLVNEQDLIEAMDTGRVSCFVTDFPNEKLILHERIIPIPHLGASTPESETNCAVMAVNQVREYLENGNIRNSVNFPETEMTRNGGCRLCIVNQNIPKMVGQITTVLADENINIEDMLNRHHDSIAYNIIDVNQDITPEQVDHIKSIKGVIRVRVIPEQKN